MSQPSSESSTVKPSPASADPSVATPLNADGESPAAAVEGGVLGRELLERIAALEAAVEASKEDVLRAHAEMENVRRRSQDEVRRAHKFAVESFAEGLLAVHDSLERAVAVESNNLEAVKQGVEMTLKQLDAAFEKFRVVALSPQKGERLDPERHQAVATQEADDVPANSIVAVMQKGYLIADRLLRPALVVVSKGWSA